METVSLDSQLALLAPVSSFQIRGSYADYHTPTYFMGSEDWNPEFQVPVTNTFYTRAISPALPLHCGIEL